MKRRKHLTLMSALVFSGLSEILPLREKWLQQKKKVVLANGCFDILHAGHIFYFHAAKQLGDILVVALNSDDSIRRLKGSNRPVFPLEYRLNFVAMLRMVDAVFPFFEDDVRSILKQFKPDFHVKGGDYKTPEDIPEHDTALLYGIEQKIVGGEKIQSTSFLIPLIGSIL